MKHIRFFIIVFFIAKLNLLNAQVNKNEVHVNSYIDSKGNLIQSHQRTAPNSTNSDNFSTKGNVNPYTGEPGWIKSDNGIVNTPTFAYEIDSAKLKYEKENWLRDYEMRKKLNEALFKDLITDSSNENPNLITNENSSEYQADTSSLNSETISNSSDLVLNENNLNSENSFYNNNQIEKKAKKIDLKSNTPNNNKYIFPIVIILSFLILFIKAKLE